MKCIILNNQNRQENDLLSDIAAFFWNSGHEVEIADERPFATDSNTDFNDYDCSISISNDHFTPQSLFINHRISLKKYFNSGLKKKTGVVLIFSNKAVFTNAVPYPHQIFNYENLDQDSLAAFFEWFKKLNLFLKP